MPEEHLPPHFILLSQSSIPTASSSTTSNAPNSTLTFPIIHYHYADDPPISLLPSNENQPYIVMDYDPRSHTPPVARSISEGVAVVGVKLSPAPGINPSVDDDRNPDMYVIETVSTLPSARSPTAESTPDWSNDPNATLIRFRQRNAALRETIEYPHSLLETDTLKEEVLAQGAAITTSTSPTSSPETMKNVPLGPS